MKKEKITELPFKVKINSMEYGYYLIEFYFNWYTSGLLSEERFKIMKYEFLYSNTKETEYLNLEGEEWVNYFTEAFDELFKLFKIGAITQEEFEKHYKILKREPRCKNN